MSTSSNALTTVRCPKCAHAFELTQAMRADIEAEVRAALQASFRNQVTALEKALTAQQAEMARKEAEAAQHAESLRADIARQVAEAAKRARAEAERAAAERVARETAEQLEAKDRELASTREKLAAATKKELELLRKERELGDRARQLEVDVERRLVEETTKIEQRVSTAAKERLESERERQRLLAIEHEQQIASFKKTIEELRQKAEQGSQTAQGEAQEIALKDVLVGVAPLDEITDVPKGERGADVLQRVRDRDLRTNAVILWESKRTRTYQDGWLAKLRDDQREAGAAVAVLVTQALPPNVRHFEQRDGVWVCSWSCAPALAAALRIAVLDVERARRAGEGRGEKMSMVYEYLTGPEAKNRITGILEAIEDMTHDLEKERRALFAQLKRRERQLDRARMNIAGFYGDLQGIAGRQLADLPALALEDGAADDDEPTEEVAISGTVDPKLVELLFRLIPADGGAIGNGSLRGMFEERALIEFSVDGAAGQYESAKAILVASGRAKKGRGRGGSLSRSTPSAAAE